MADNIVGGLFGVDPEQLMRQRQATDASNAYRFANLAPAEQAQYGAYVGGSQLGRAAIGLLGGDPELEKISSIKQLSSQFDLTNPQGMRDFAGALQQIAPREAAMAAKRAGEMDLNIATIKQKSRESQPKTDELVDRERFNYFLEQTNGDRQAAARLYYEDENRQKLRRAEATGSKVTFAGQKNVLEVDKKDAENLIKVRDTAENVIPRLQEQAAALQKGIAAGTFSDARVTFSTALSSLGVKDKATLDMLKNTKTFNANRIELAASVAKQLGVNPTDRDFKASLDRFASASDAPEASAAFINDLLTIQQGKLTQANEGLNYFRKNDGSFSGYDRPLPVSPVVSADPFAGKTLDQLKKMRAEAQKNK
jgi:hypothetical protein